MMKKWIVLALAFALALPACAFGEGVENKLGTPITLPTKKSDSAPSNTTDVTDTTSATDATGVRMENKLGMPVELPSLKGKGASDSAQEETVPEEATIVLEEAAPEKMESTEDASIRMIATVAEDVDLSGLNYEELAKLRDRINLAMWQSEDWQQVTVPQGVWIVGEDIPAGHWTITAADGAWVMIEYGSQLDPNGREVSWESDVCYFDNLTSATSSIYDAATDQEQIDLEMTNGMYFVVSEGNVVFTPYSGKPSLGFKW